MIIEYVSSRLDVAIVIVSAIAVSLFPNPETLITLLVLGGLMMLMLEYDIENRENR